MYNKIINLFTMNSSASSLDEEYERDDVSTQVPDRKKNSSINSSFLHNSTHKTNTYNNSEYMPNGISKFICDIISNNLSINIKHITINGTSFHI